MMRNSKHGLKALVLMIMAVLGVMAFAAAGAQAQGTLGSFLINLGAALLASVTGKLAEEKPSLLLVANRNLKLECQELNVEEGKIDSSTDALGKVTFLGCLSFALSNGEHLSNCVLKSLGTITAQALVLPVLHGGENFLLFEPIGENFTVISYKAGMGCVLPLNNPVSGSVVALVDALDAVTQLILFSEAIQLLVGDQLAFGVNKAYIDAHAEIKLTGLHEGQKLGIH